MFRLPSLALARGRSRLLSTTHNKIMVDSPFTGEIVAEVPLASEEEAAAVVAAADAAQREWKRVPLADRLKACEAFLANVEANKDVIAKVGGRAGERGGRCRPCPPVSCHWHGVPGRRRSPCRWASR